MEQICYLSIIPDEIVRYIISLTENKIFDLCLINKYFNKCSITRITDNFKYPKLTNIIIKSLT